MTITKRKERTVVALQDISASTSTLSVKANLELPRRRLALTSAIPGYAAYRRNPIRNFLVASAGLSDGRQEW